MLSEPVDLQIRVQLAKLVRNSHVPPSVPQPDRRGDVQGALAPGAAAYPGRRTSWSDELPQEQVDLDRVAHMRAMP